MCHGVADEAVTEVAEPRSHELARSVEDVGQRESGEDGFLASEERGDAGEEVEDGEVEEQHGVAFHVNGGALVDDIDQQGVHDDS